MMESLENRHCDDGTDGLCASAVGRVCGALLISRESAIRHTQAVSGGFVPDSLCRESSRCPFAPSSANKLRRDIGSQRGNPPFRFRDSLGTSSFAVDFSIGYRVGQFRIAPLNWRAP